MKSIFLSRANVSRGFSIFSILAFAASQTNAQQTAPSPQPNIVYILTDDLGYGDIDGLNPGNKIKTPQFKTPQIDQLAADGMTFTEAHSSSAVCTPSRYSILTGRYNWRSTLKKGVLGGLSRPLIEEGRLTVAELLRSRGYQTAAIGKWHLGLGWARLPDARGNSNEGSDTDEASSNLIRNAGAGVDFTKPISDGPTTHGFDYFFGISASLDMSPYTFIENDRVTAQPTIQKGTVYGADGKHYRIGPQASGFKAEDVLPILTQHATDYIDQRAADARNGKLFFLYLALPSPHTPIAPTIKWQGKSGLNYYADYVMETDDYIGKVLAALDRDRLTTNTLVVFASDNGCSPEADFPYLLSHDHDPSAGRRGYKADIYDGGHRVPMIVRWPGHIAPGTQTSDFTCLDDFIATCTDIFGVKLPDNAAEDSISFLPVILGRTGPPPRDTLVESSINGSFGIRKGQWKLAFCPDSGGWSYPRPGRDNTDSWPRFQLFDAVADPEEKTNVYGQHQEIVNRLGRLIRDYIINGRSTPGVAQTNDSVKAWQQTQWLDQFKSTNLATGVIPADQPQ
jgi:arylsulfatase A-like enzyme